MVQEKTTLQMPLSMYDELETMVMPDSGESETCIYRIKSVKML